MKMLWVLHGGCIESAKRLLALQTLAGWGIRAVLHWIVAQECVNAFRNAGSEGIPTILPVKLMRMWSMTAVCMTFGLKPCLIGLHAQAGLAQGDQIISVIISFFKSNTRP